MKRTFTLIVASVICLQSFAQPDTIEVWGRRIALADYLRYQGIEKDEVRPVTWGDQGDGTFVNPVLNVDYSDPDVIRVDDTYYMVASDFHFLGMQMLSSKDLVNWEFTSQLYDRFDYPGWETMEHYSNGSWAPSVRYHDGKFFVYFCTPREGLFMTSSESPYGPWSKLLLVHEGAGWEDPCPFWDEDGNAYLGHSLVGAGPIIMHRMSPDGTTLLDEGVEVYRGNIAEGTKIHKWDGMYYLSIPEGGVGQGNQVVLRSESLYGPYERKVVLEKGSTRINGPHQGAIVDTPGGEWYFIHFQQTPVLGRVVHLQPVSWEDGWPIMGEDYDGNGVGEPVHSWKVPTSTTGKAQKPHKPASSDKFSGKTLGLQWQFNHNPVPEAVSLTEKRGYLITKALKADSFHMARNTVTQKLMGYTGTATVKVKLTRMSEGERLGLAVMGLMEQKLGVKMEGGKRYVYFENEKGGEVFMAPLKRSRIWLRMEYDVRDFEIKFSYAEKRRRFIPVGEPFVNLFGNWKGVRPALFNYNTIGEGGEALFDEFVYDFDCK